MEPGRPKRIPPPGAGHELVDGPRRAVVVEVGGGLRSYAVDAREVLDGYAADEMCTAARGQPLIPWPNRLRDGRYRFGGRTHQLALSEPERHNAIHGLVRWANWSAERRSAARVVMRHVLHPQDGYPFSLDIAIDYRLDAGGLRVETTVTNVGGEPCPAGAGAHPYLSAGGGTIDGAELQAPGERWMPTDDRGIPVDSRPVAGGPYDFRVSRPIGATQLDTAFSDLQRGADGLARVRLATGGGPSPELWLDEGYPYLMLFTGDALPDAARRRRGLGVEPMTCAPDAFRSGAGLRTLEPGESLRAAWGIVA